MTAWAEAEQHVVEDNKVLLNKLLNKVGGGGSGGGVVFVGPGEHGEGEAAMIAWAREKQHVDERTSPPQQAP
jgi:hypothetical protein